MAANDGRASHTVEWRQLVLSRCTLFHHAVPATIAELARVARVRALERGAMLFGESSRSGSLFVVADGLLRVFVTSLDGSEPTLTILFAGEHVGEMGAVQGTERSASVAALRPSTVLEVSGSAFTHAYETDGAIARAIVEQLAHRLRRTSNQLCDLTLLDLGARLAKYFVNEMSVGPNGRNLVELAVNQAELGQLIGGARQSVNQLLHTMERDGLITVLGRRVEVLDVAALRRRAAMIG